MRTQNVTFPAPCHIALNFSGAPQNCAPDSVDNTPALYGPFFLFIRWILGWAVGDMETAAEAAVFQRRHGWRYISRSYNRKERRKLSCKIATGNNLRAFYSLIEHTETKAQFTEKVSRHCIIGRAILYGFRYWHKKRLSMTKLTPFDFGGWDTPVSAGKSDGLWDAQALPDWFK